MTTLGKILVIVNLVFSLVTVFLIAMAYQARTNWNLGFEKLKKNYLVSEVNVKATMEELKLAKKAGDDEAARLQKEITKLNTTIADLTKANDNAEVARRAELEKAKAQQSNTDAATAELQQRRDEVKQLQQHVAQRDQKLLDLEVQRKDILDRYIRADIAARSSHQRNKELMEQIERLAQEVDRLKLGSAVAGTVERRPPEDAKGLVKEIDAKSGLVTISIGSDAGLAKGHVLECYRLKPEARYLGKLRILEVDHHEAVGRLVSGQRLHPLQSGDTVATNILDAR
jgi:hypothetical protein